MRQCRDISLLYSEAVIKINEYQSIVENSAEREKAAKNWHAAVQAYSKVVEKFKNKFGAYPLAYVKTIWSAFAFCMASICLGNDGKVNQPNCVCLLSFLNGLSGMPISIFPYDAVPGMELIRDQAIAVLEKLITKPDNFESLAYVLNESTKNKLSSNGQLIFDKISSFQDLPSSSSSSSSTFSSSVESSTPPYTASHAILQSLFTPHRQIGLPTCNMDAIIINEAFNNPARLARIFMDILTHKPGEKIYLASTNEIVLQGVSIPPSSSSSPVLFMEVRPSTPHNADNQKYLLEESSDGEAIGIEYIKGEVENDNNNNNNNNAKNEINIGLRIPINDLNDALLANLMQNVYGGVQGGASSIARGVVVTKGFIRSRLLYFGVSGDSGFMVHVKQTAQLPDTSISDLPYLFSEESMNTLQQQASELMKNGISIASTFFSQPSLEDTNIERTEGEIHKGEYNLDKINGHVENLYLQNIVGISQMKVGEHRIVGDRNWCNGQFEPVYLVIQRVDDQLEEISSKKTPKKRFAFTMAAINRAAKEVELNLKGFRKIGEIFVYNQKT
ncbi:MAG: hypothetical protein LBI81_03625 [Puniceicoccales bacterium]|nr:hypothetical protein [Puniceicoccales bacterium]